MLSEEESPELIKNRLQNEPEFKKAYDEYLAKTKAEGRLSDSDLENIRRGFIGFETCSRCNNYTLTPFTFGIYASCSECDYSERLI